MIQSAGNTTEDYAIREKLYKQLQPALTVIPMELANQFAIAWPLIADRVNNYLVGDSKAHYLIGDNDMVTAYMNTGFHGNFMRSNLKLKSAQCLIEVMVWSYRTMMARGFKPDYFIAEMEAFKAVIKKHLGWVMDASPLLSLYDTMIEAHPDILTLALLPAEDELPNGELKGVVDQFINSLLTNNENEAQSLARMSIKNAAEIPFWWEEVIAPAMRVIGQLWSKNEITVIQEHMATAIAQRVMAKNFPALPHPPKRLSTIAVIVPPEEMHDMGASMVRDVAQLMGFNTYFSPANTPVDSVNILLDQKEIDMIILSNTIPSHLTATQKMIEMIRSTPYDDKPIIVGGQAYKDDDGLHKKIGADITIPRLDGLMNYFVENDNAVKA